MSWPALIGIQPGHCDFVYWRTVSSSGSTSMETQAMSACYHPPPQGLHVYVAAND